jgi:hypothetical protein
MGYTGDHHFIIFDIDAEDNWDACRRAAHELATKIKAKEGYDCLVTFSGKKGFHIWIFVTDAIHHTVEYAWQKDILTSLGYAQSSAHIFTKNGVNAETLITFGDNAGLVIKVPFSQHQSRAGFWEIPISVDEILEYNKEVPPTDEQWHRGIGLFENTQRVDNLLVMMEASGEEALTRVEPEARHRPTARLGPFVIPDASAHVGQILEDVRQTPCLKKCMEISTSQHGVYWLRAPLVSVLGVRRYRREDIAVFFRQHINDDEDNAHPDMWPCQ